MNWERARARPNDAAIHIHGTNIQEYIFRTFSFNIYLFMICAPLIGFVSIFGMYCVSSNSFIRFSIGASCTCLAGDVVAIVDEPEMAMINSEITSRRI